VKRNSNKQKTLPAIITLNSQTYFIQSLNRIEWLAFIYFDTCLSWNESPVRKNNHFHICLSIVKASMPKVEGTVSPSLPLFFFALFDLCWLLYAVTSDQMIFYLFLLGGSWKFDRMESDRKIRKLHLSF
jgi:hypothetical protein